MEHMDAKSTSGKIDEEKLTRPGWDGIQSEGRIRGSGSEMTAFLGGPNGDLCSLSAA
jgi:hypothetical protein